MKIIQRTKSIRSTAAILYLLGCAACGGSSGGGEAPSAPPPAPTPPPPPPTSGPQPPATPPERTGFYIGADLSYVNRLESAECDADYRVNLETEDPFDIFRDFGSNLVRVRLFNDPAYNHGDLADVTETIRRARDAGMAVMLDFHYSDEFADPARQTIPAAWEGAASTAELADLLYQYTYDVLVGLEAEGLMPEFVQVGNEINGNMSRPDTLPGFPLDGDRQAALVNAGLQAVEDAGSMSAIDPQTIIHIAQPENVDYWFDLFVAAGITHFDIIGVSYYSAFSSQSLNQAVGNIGDWKTKYAKDVMIVETAYPWTLDFADSQNNILYTDALEIGYDATPEGQRDYLIDLTQGVIDEGGIGVVYWEPAWISTPCQTAFGQGSSWENATMFDFNNQNNVHEGIEFYSHEYDFPE